MLVKVNYSRNAVILQRRGVRGERDKQKTKQKKFACQEMRNDGRSEPRDKRKRQKEDVEAFPSIVSKFSNMFRVCVVKLVHWWLIHFIILLFFLLTE